jgi:conjugal transfer pilus assembly protein TraW
MHYLFVFLLGFTGLVHAENIGVQGTVYPIAEQDIVMFIESRLRTLQANGDIERHQKAFQARALASADRPPAVSGVTRTQKARIFHHDPSITLSRPVTYGLGKTLIAEGTHFNPLSRITLSRALLFYDGDDAEQVIWAQKTNEKYQGKTLMILVKGSVKDQSKQFERAIYFDQHGKLTKKFGIRQVPAQLTQEALRLRIEEVKL